MKKIEIEAEGKEIIIQNSNGDYAIIPKNKVKEIQQLLDDECYTCIDSFVDTLPSMEDYAQDGTVITFAEDPLRPPSVEAPKPIDYSINGMTYSQRLESYKNNPKTGGVPTLGGNWRKVSDTEREGLIKYYETLPKNEINNTVLEEYESLKRGEFYVDKSSTPEDIESIRTKYINAPTDLALLYKETEPELLSKVSTPKNSIPNKVLRPNYTQFTLQRSDNPHASAAVRVQYSTPEELKEIQKEFQNIKTDADYKKSRFYSQSKENLVGTASTPLKIK